MCRDEIIPGETNVTANGSGGTNGLGMYNLNSSPTIRHCTLDGTSIGILVDEDFGFSTVRVIQSSIIGGAIIGSGILTCVNSDNGVATALNATCL